jgi:NAD(P)-dependent dehydrogenase (short-subunit alcohol dehydrogenase family)
MKLPRWTEENIPDQTGRVAIVTGSNTGLGFCTAHRLAEKGASVVLACRSAEKSEVARKKILEMVPNANIELIPLDLTLQQSVKEFVAAYQDTHDRLDLLINNAGVMMCPFARTEDGYELQIATNHFGHFTLTALLLPLLMKTENSRIVSVSSMAARMGSIHFDDLNYIEREYNKMEAYSQTKLANLLFARELNRRLEAAGSKTISLAAHPGWTQTDLQRHSILFKILNPFFAMPSPRGSLPTLRAATDRNAKGGKFYGPHGFNEMKGYPVLVNPEKGKNSEAINWDDSKRLFDMSEDITGVKFEFNKVAEKA